MKDLDMSDVLADARRMEAEANTPKLHVHVWTEENADEPITEFNVPAIDAYDDPDGYVQFGADYEGKWLEIRLSFADIKKLHEGVEDWESFADIVFGPEEELRQAAQAEQRPPLQ